MNLDTLIIKYQDRNKEILLNNPKLAMEFDWSDDAYELAHNESFIKDLKKRL